MPSAFRAIAGPGDLPVYAFTPDRVPITSEKDVSAVVLEHCRNGYGGIVLARDGGEHVSATGEGFGPYTVEWFPAEKTGSHLRVNEELKCREVLGIFLAFFRDGPGWRESVAWVEVEDEPPSWLSRLFGGLSLKRGAGPGDRGENPA